MINHWSSYTVSVMSTEPKYLLQPMDRNSIASDVSQLLLKLNVANGEVYRIDNLKQINRVDPPMLVHGSDGRLIKIRSFSSDATARAFLDFLGNQFWPHTGIVLGRCGRAIAEDWVHGESVTDNRYHPDQITNAGAALGSLHAPLAGHGARNVGWVNALHWVKSISDRICRLSRRGSIDGQDRERLLQLVDRYASDTLEYGLTHGDFAPDNLLVDAQGRLVCIDNETVGVDALDYDLTRTILRWPLSGARRHAFLSAYSAYRDLGPTAHQSPFWLVAVLAGTAEWEYQHQGTPSERVLRCLHRLAATERLRRTVRVKSGVKIDNRLSLRFLGTRIEVISEDTGLLAWLEEFLAPHFAVGFDPHENREAWSVEMRANEVDYCELEATCTQQERASIGVFLRDEDWEYARDCGERGEERLFFRDTQEIVYGVDARIQRIRVYSRKANPTSRLAAMKVVRELGMRELWHDGKLMLHAGAFASGRNGCLIVGPKGAGKTTLLTYLLQSEGVSYVTNDRAALVETKSGFLIHGIPTIVSVRSGTTSLFPILREGQKRRRYRHLQTRDEALVPDVSSPIPRKMLKKPDLSPAQYTTHLQCITTTEARLAAVIVPNVRTSCDGLEPSGFHITPLDPRSARMEIERALFGAAKGWPGGGMIPPEPTVPTYLVVHRERMVKKLVRTIPCFRIDIHEVAFKTGNFAATLNLLASSSTEAANEYATP
jgi:Ser/Thr protein kinase RdoA (MazF antagonist)